MYSLYNYVKKVTLGEDDEPEANAQDRQRAEYVETPSMQLHRVHALLLSSTGYDQVYVGLQRYYDLVTTSELPTTQTEEQWQASTHTSLAPISPMDVAKVDEIYYSLRAKMEDASRNNDDTSLLKICRLVSLLQRIRVLHSQPSQGPSVLPATQDEGLAAYLTFLRKLVLDHAVKLTKSLFPNMTHTRSDEDGQGGMDTQTSWEGSTHASADLKDTGVSCLTALGEIYSNIIDLVEYHYPLVSHGFGQNAAPYMVAQLHEQSDKHTSSIFTLLMQHYNLSKVLEQMMTLDAGVRPATPPNAGSEVLYRDPLELDELLDVMARITSYSQKYVNVLKQRVGSTPAKVVRGYGPGGFLDLDHLLGSIQLVLGYYLPLEDRYLRAAMTRAISDNLPPIADVSQTVAQSLAETSSIYDDDDPDEEQGKLYSGIMDDIFFLLRKVSRRSMSTLSAHTACSVLFLGLAAGGLEVQWIGAVRDRLLAYQRTMAIALAAFGKLEEDANTPRFIMLLNDIERASEYLQKLKDELEGDAAKHFGADAPRVQQCLQDAAPVHMTLLGLLNHFIPWFAGSIAPRISPLLVHFHSPAVSYNMNEADYERAEVNDPFMSAFIAGLHSILSPFIKDVSGLSVGNRDRVVAHIAGHTAQLIEADVMAYHRFTPLGAVQLGKEVRMLVDYFSSLGSGGTLSYKFVRLSQMAQLLNVDRLQEVVDYWDGDSKAAWRLTQEEVKVLLLRRTDLAPDQISALRLY
eukprot:TRINITY_DN7105_c0_g1_i4.p1 TRINITY_DN7105_c0_g1~~TRINITY_DN7105_c0_g1_i4.p1  ORF type:complete len:744 (+),score=182.39 TRINITY_DN7105_c0_g1_i4:410-2641(+)